MTDNRVYGTQFSETERERSMTELREMYNYFSLKTSEYEELERLDRIIRTNGGPVSRASKVWGILLLIAGALFLFAAFSSASAGIFIFDFLLIGGGILLLTSNSRKRKRKQAEVANAKNRLMVVAQDLIDHYNNYGYCPLGVEYTSPAQLEAIYEVIRQGRADTLKEAVNVLLTEEHFAEVERLQRETAQAAWATCAATRANVAVNAAQFAYQVRRDNMNS